jgi:hypothetical protein
MRRILLAAAAAALLSPAVLAVDREFKEIVRAIGDEFRARPKRLPFVGGFVNFVTFFARPAGAKHIDFAIFENLDTRGRTGEEVRDLVQRAVGRGWRPFVQVYSRRHGHQETVLVYMRPEGRDCRLLVTTVERHEAVVVQLKLNPEGVQRWVHYPLESARNSRRLEADDDE